MLYGGYLKFFSSITGLYYLLVPFLKSCSEPHGTLYFSHKTPLGYYLKTGGGLFQSLLRLSTFWRDPWSMVVIQTTCINFLGLLYKLQQTWWLKKEIDSLTGLEAKKFDVRVSAELAPCGGSERESIPGLLASAGCWQSLVFLVVRQPQGSSLCCHLHVAFFSISVCLLFCLL